MNSETFTLAGIGLTLLALYMNNKKTIKENFGMLPPRTFKTERVAQMGPSKGDMYEIPGYAQAALAPRAAGMVDYGPNIRYNMPSAGHLAVNKNNPIGYSNMVYNKDATVSEGYTGPAQGCRGGEGLEQIHVQNQMSAPQNTQTTDMLPVQSMNTPGGVVNALGQEQTQPVVYDRFIYANQKSRLRSLGDPIRGDLPIVPHQKGWFAPSANAQIDLRDGALMAIGGADNETSKQLMALQNAASGGLLDTGSGINYGVQQNSYASAGVPGAGGDISVSAFP